MELSSKLKAMKFMKRNEVPDGVKQKEKEQLDLANRNHWTVESSASQANTKLKFSIEYDTTSANGGKIQSKDSRRTFKTSS